MTKINKKSHSTKTVEVSPELLFSDFAEWFGTNDLNSIMESLDKAIHQLVFTIQTDSRHRVIEESDPIFSVLNDLYNLRNYLNDRLKQLDR